MRSELPGEGVDPLRGGDEQLERGRGLDVLHAHGEDVLVLADGALDLARDEARAVARRGEHQDEAAGPLDASDDLIAIGAAGTHVARRDPAFEAAFLELVGDVLRLALVGLGVADKGRELGSLGFGFG
jgi:hypothetical protein